MGIYNDAIGTIKIEPELTVDEINYFRGRLQHYILSFDWKNWSSTEEGALKFAKIQAETYIKMERINIDPYSGYNPDYLEFIAKMLGSRVSGVLKICSSTTYGDPNVNGGWTNGETTIELKDRKVFINGSLKTTNKKEKETETIDKKETHTELIIGGRVVQVGKSRDDLTLLKYQNELRSLGFYHSWKVDGEELLDVDDDILNLSNNNICYSIPYFDGTANNFLFIKGGLVTTLNPISINIVTGSYFKTKQDLLDETYGKGCFKIVNLPYLKGVIKY